MEIVKEDVFAVVNKNSGCMFRAEISECYSSKGLARRCLNIARARLRGVETFFFMMSQFGPNQNG